MKNPVMTISINNKELSPTNISNFQLHSDIYSNLPNGSFILKDQGGDELSQFNITIGSTVAIIVFDGSPEDNNSPPGGLSGAAASILGGAGEQDDDTIIFPPFVVTSLNYDTSQISSFDGSVHIEFSHPWSLYGDFTNHAYPPMQLSELIKKVVQESQRGIDIPVEDDNFEKSNDSGKQSRYKCGESDYNFIIDKLLPYTQLNDAPAYFFLDSLGNTYLQSYKTMFDKGEVANVVATGDPARDKESLPNIPINSITVEICKDALHDRSVFEKIITRIFIEDLTTRKFMSGGKLPISNCGLGEFGSTFPVNFLLMSTIKATSSKIMLNRSYEDQLALASTWQRDLDNMFKINVFCAWAGEHVKVGDTVNFVSAPVMMGEPSQPHDRWLNGKWVVARVSHVKESNSDQLNSILTIIRPTFSLTSRPTLQNREMLYSVI